MALAFHLLYVYVNNLHEAKQNYIKFLFMFPVLLVCRVFLPLRFPPQYMHISSTKYLTQLTNYGYYYFCKAHASAHYQR